MPARAQEGDRPSTLLLIEDNPVDARLIQELVHRKGLFECVSATTFEEGQTALQQRSVDVVVLDLELPDVGGLDGVRRLHAEHEELPIVVLTAYDDVRVALEAVHLSAQEYLIKGSINQHVLHRALVHAIERQRVQSQLARRRLIETTISAISSRFARARLDRDEPFVEALHDLGDLCGAERAYIFLLADDGQTMDNVLQWTSPTRESPLAPSRGVPIAPFQWSMARLQRGEHLRIDDCDELPEEAAAERRQMEARGVRALLAFPLRVEGELGGYIGLDSFRGPRSWQDVDFGSMLLAADAIGAAMGRARAIRALAESEAHHRDLFEHAPLAYVSLDAVSHRIRRANRAAERLTGTSAEQLVDTPFAALFAGPERDRALSVLAAGGEVEDLELAGGAPDGEERFVSLTVRPEHSGQGALRELRCALVETTERRRMQSSLAQADRLASMGILAGGIAHEVNNPLAVLLLHLQELETVVAELPETPEAQADELGRLIGGARASAERIREIVGGLASFSESDEAVTRRVDVVAALTAAASIALNEVRYRARLVQGSEAVPYVMADEGRLVQVFLTLIINAAQAIPEGDSEHNEVRLLARAEEGDIVVSIEDTGAGISAENLPKVFDPFFTTKDAALGTGLGLFICRNIIEGYGGVVAIESEVGRGTCITVRLPAAQPASDAASAPRELPAESSRARLLIVDDEPLIGRAVARLLGKAVECTCVTNGQDAFAHLRTVDFDLILCDLMMPDVSGMDLFDWLEANRPELAPRVLFMTGGAFTPKAQSFVARLPNPVLRKPFEIAVLKKLLLERLSQ